MKYDVDYFLNKFDAIPDNCWTTNLFKNYNGSCCALGHCGYTDTTCTPEGQQLSDLVYTQLNVLVIDINDRIYEFGETPKERVMNALILIKAGVSI